MIAPPARRYTAGASWNADEVLLCMTDGVHLDVVGQLVVAVEEQARAFLRRHDQVDRREVVLVARRRRRRVVDVAVVVGRDVLAARARDCARGTAARIDVAERVRRLDVAERRRRRTADRLALPAPGRSGAVRAVQRDRVLREIAVAGEHLLGLVVADAGHDRALVGALAERELVALAARRRPCRRCRSSPRTRRPGNRCAG